MILKEDLEKLYLHDELTIREISKVLNVSVGTVFNYLKKFEINTRQPMTERTKQRISDSLMGHKSNRKGCTLSDKTKKKISDSKKGKFKNKTEYGGHKKKRIDGYIYVFVPDHPYASKAGYVMEHILVMEKHIGRYITRDEVVHHKNKKRDDNRIENLQLMTFKEHASLHSKERWAQKKGEMTYQ